jgi:hypothetical protein
MKPFTSLYLILLLVLSSFITPASNQVYFLKINGNRPFGFTFDGKGTMYMVTAPEAGNGTLSKVTPDGKITYIATLQGSFIGPGIDFSDNFIFITVGNKLLKVNPDGLIKVVADSFSRAFDVKVDLTGNIYVADDLACTIYKISRTGEKNIFYKGETKGLFVLTSLVFDKSFENLYAKEGKKILRFSMKESTSKKPELILNNVNTFYLCRDNSNNIYASTLDNVIKIDPKGSYKNLFWCKLKTSIGLSVGDKEFDEQTLYIAVQDGIVKIPVKNLN